MDMSLTRKVLNDIAEQLVGGTGANVSVYKRGSPEPTVERMRRVEIIIPNDDTHMFVEGVRELIRLTERYS